MRRRIVIRMLEGSRAANRSYRNTVSVFASAMCVLLIITPLLPFLQHVGMIQLPRQIYQSIGLPVASFFPAFPSSRLIVCYPERIASSFLSFCPSLVQASVNIILLSNFEKDRESEKERWR